MVEIQVWHMVAGFIVLIFGPPGATALAVKVTMNGIKEDIGEIKTDVKETRTEVGGLRERMSVLEAVAERGQP